MRRERVKQFVSQFLALSILIVGMSSLQPNAIASEGSQSLDIEFLQQCLQTDNASLDVMVLMDSSYSLRKPKRGDGDWKGSDPERRRGDALRSALELLQELANNSNSQFRAALRNFGNNDDAADLNFLSKEKWISWQEQFDIDTFIDNALYDFSPGTEWGLGLKSARDYLEKNLNKRNVTSCPVMIWFTDGENDDEGEGNIDQMCSSSGAFSINWFRENNILVLGALLKHDEQDQEGVKNFRAIVEGTGVRSCGENKEDWTKGSVVEANGAADLAWQFVGLIAGLNNLINLDVNDSRFIADPGTGHIEIFIRDSAENISIYKGNRLFCSQREPRICEFEEIGNTGISKITIYPENPDQDEVFWEIRKGNSTYTEENVSVYAGLNSESSRSKDVILKVSPQQASVDEGEKIQFAVELQTHTGSTLDVGKFQEVTICASLDNSVNQDNPCTVGKSKTIFTKRPSLSDTSAQFVATIRTKSNREYKIFKSANIDVVETKIFPKLICVDECKNLNSLNNKHDIAKNLLKVLQAEDETSSNYKIYLIGYKVIKDDNTEREYGGWNFSLSNGSNIDWNDKTALLSPKDEIELSIGTNIGGESEVSAVITYAIVDPSNPGESVAQRELEIRYAILDESNIFLQTLLVLLAYLVSLGLPYLYLLYTARRSAKIVVPDEEIAYLVTPISIQTDGTLVNAGETDSETFHTGFRTPSHEKLRRDQVKNGQSKTTVDRVIVEVIAPKWNPFKNPVTVASLPGYLLVSSAGGGQGEIRDSITTFSPNLVGEALVYFSKDENLSPETVSETVTQEIGVSVYSDTTSVSETSSKLVASTKSISGFALFIITPYGNRIRLLEELAVRLTSNWDRESITNQINTLREIALQNAIETNLKVPTSTQPTINEPESENQNFSTGESQSESLFADKDEWGFEETTKKSTSIWGEDEGKDQSSESKRSLWDD